MDRKPQSRRENQCTRRSSWCCSFGVPPTSPENLSFSYLKTPQKSEILSKSGSSYPNSPQSTRTGLGLVGRIDPRRILSPGRVSPIDSDVAADSVPEVAAEPSPVVNAPEELMSGSFRKAAVEKSRRVEVGSSSDSSNSNATAKDEGGLRIFDVRLTLRGKNGGSLVLELNSEVLSGNSAVFAELILDCQKRSNSSTGNLCRIEVPDVENLAVFRQTIELMFEDDITKHLLKIGVYRSIDILEVSAGIMFRKGVLSCLNYLEAVPWTEEEEEKVKALFTRFNFDDATTKDILARLYSLDSADSQQNLARRLVGSVTNSVDANARNELKSLVKGLLCKSSVYEKDQPDLNKEDIYHICHSCLCSLVSLFEDASEAAAPIHNEQVLKKEHRPLLECVSRQVDNVIWLLDILIDRQMAEDFVGIWAGQRDLLRIHGSASPLVRYEISRISAILFIAMGTRQLHCRLEERVGLLRAWFGPMLSDFGWLQRCRKGLDMKAVEEGMGHTLLTLPLKQQYVLFMEWFQCFSKHGTECPNLSKSFQVWWRRSFLRSSETHAIECR